jgi:hypothetical protein
MENEPLLTFEKLKFIRESLEYTNLNLKIIPGIPHKHLTKIELVTVGLIKVNEVMKHLKAK